MGRGGSILKQRKLLGWYAAPVVLLAAAGIAVCAAQNIPGKVLLHGAVADADGAPLTNAQLVVHWDPSGAKTGLTTNVGILEDRFLKTDTHGNYYAEIPPGFYDVLVAAPGFSPSCAKLRLKPGENATFNAKLKADPLVAKELAAQSH
jgi:hypothetical protein